MWAELLQNGKPLATAFRWLGRVSTMKFVHCKLFLANCSISGWLQSSPSKSSTFHPGRNGGSGCSRSQSTHELPAERGWALPRLQPDQHPDCPPCRSEISLGKRARWKGASTPGRLLRLLKTHVSAALGRTGIPSASFWGFSCADLLAAGLGGSVSRWGPAQPLRPGWERAPRCPDPTWERPASLLHRKLWTVKWLLSF